MGYDDRFYYGQAKVIILADPSDDGKTVSLACGNSKYYTNTLADGTCTLVVPGTNRYTISLIDGEESESKGDVLVGYGDCKAVDIKGE